MNCPKVGSNSTRQSFSIGDEESYDEFNSLEENLELIEEEIDMDEVPEPVVYEEVELVDED